MKLFINILVFVAFALLTLLMIDNWDNIMAMTLGKKISMVGIGINAIGSYSLIKLHFKTDEEIKKEASTRFDYSQPVIESLKKRRKSALIATGCLLLGFYLQLIGHFV